MRLLGLWLALALLAACGKGSDQPASPPAPPTDTPAGPEARATAENNALIAGYMLESGQFDASIVDWLREQPWTLDGSQASIDLITTLVHVDDVDAFDETNELHEERVGEAMAFLGTLTDQAWYSDGFDTTERQRVNVLLSAAAAMDAQRLFANEGSSEAGLRWVYAAGLTLDASLFTTVPTGDGGQLFVAGLHEGEFEAETRRAMALAQEYYETVEDYAGPIEGAGVVIAVDPGLRYCGIAFIARAVIVLHPACLDDNVVVHELIHLAAPNTYFAWFNEGIAYAGADRISGKQSQEDRCEGYDSGVCADDHTLSDGEGTYGRHAAHGAEFFAELEALIGQDALSRLIQATSERNPESQTELFDRIREAAPPDKRSEVDALLQQLELDLLLAGF